MRGPFMFGLSLLCMIGLQTLYVTAAAPELRQVILLHRHGARAPIKVFLPDAFDEHWPLGLGQLTGQGMREVYNLGVKLRKDYVEDIPLITTPFNPKYYYCRSTDVTRTLQSAQSFLYGFFPTGTGPVNNATWGQGDIPLRFQPAPVTTRPAAIDLDLTGEHWAPTYCAGSAYGMGEGIAELQSVFPAWKQTWSQFASQPDGIFHLMETLLNVTLQPDGSDWLYAYDAFMCYNYTGRMFEYFPTLTQSQFMQIYDMVTTYFQYLTQLQVSNCLQAGKLMNLMVHNLDCALGISPSSTGDVCTDGDKTYKMVHYSAHDTTVYPLMAALGTYGRAPVNYDPPHFAAHTVMELWQTDDGPFVVTKYNDRLVTLPWCNSSSDKHPALDGSCAVPTLRNYFLNCGRPSLFSEHCDMPSDCPPATPSKQEGVTSRMWFGVLIGLLCGLLTTVLVYVFWMRPKLKANASLNYSGL